MAADRWCWKRAADGTVGYGETLPRPYVTGETVGGVVASIEDTFIEELLTFRPGTFPRRWNVSTPTVSG